DLHTRIGVVQRVEQHGNGGPGIGSHLSNRENRQTPAPLLFLAGSYHCEKWRQASCSQAAQSISPSPPARFRVSRGKNSSQRSDRSLRIVSKDEKSKDRTLPADYAFAAEPGLSLSIFAMILAFQGGVSYAIQLTRYGIPSTPI